MSSEDTKPGGALFQRRALQFARILGHEHDKYADLPDYVKKALECLGYDGFLRVLINFDLIEGKTQTQIANRYGITRSQVRSRAKK